jgi:hypothetical protein
LLASVILSGLTGTSAAYDSSDITILKESNLIPESGTRLDASNLSNGLPVDSIFLSKEYRTYLPWINETQIQVKFIFDPNLWLGKNNGIQNLESRVSGLRGLPLSEASFLNTGISTFDRSFNTDNLEYGLQISTLFYDSSVDLFFWTGRENSPFTPLSAFTFASPDPFRAHTTTLLQLDNSEYYSRNRNIAAAWSTDLSFLGFIHQGTAPKIRLETSYRSDEFKAMYDASLGSLNHQGEFNELSFGLAYEGRNKFELLDSSYGISWGFGYSYSRALNVPEIIADTGFEFFDTSFGTHSGNINASTSWNNMRLMTKVMYLYDIQSKGGMTMMQANFSPDLRWTYGIKANFYDDTASALWPWADDSEHVSLSVTYKW